MGHWFFRVVEHEDGTWRCRRGLEEFDWHHALEDAITHIVEVALRHRPAEVFVHFRNGAVRSLGVF